MVIYHIEKNIWLFKRTRKLDSYVKFNWNCLFTLNLSFQIIAGFNFHSSDWWKIIQRMSFPSQFFLLFFLEHSIFIAPNQTQRHHKPAQNQCLSRKVLSETSHWFRSLPKEHWDDFFFFHINVYTYAQRFSFHSNVSNLDLSKIMCAALMTKPELPLMFFVRTSPVRSSRTASPLLFTINLHSCTQSSYS